MHRFVWATTIVLAVLPIGCGADDVSDTTASSATMGTGASDGAGGRGGGAGARPAMTLTSSAFEDGMPIPEPYTCNGLNVSPPLSWTPGPSGTMSYAIVFRDVDAGG